MLNLITEDFCGNKNLWTHVSVIFCSNALSHVFELVKNYKYYICRSCLSAIHCKASSVYLLHLVWPLYCRRLIDWLISITEKPTTTQTANEQTQFITGKTYQGTKKWSARSSWLMRVPSRNTHLYEASSLQILLTLLEMCLLCLYRGPSLLLYFCRHFLQPLI